MKNVKLNKKVKELSSVLDLNKVTKSIKVNSTTLEELAGIVCIISEYMAVRFEGRNQDEKAVEVYDLLRLFMVKINIANFASEDFKIPALAA